MDAENTNEQKPVQDEAVQQGTEQGAEFGAPPAPPAPSVTDASYFRNRKQMDKIGEPVTVGDVTFLVGRPSLATLTKQGIIPSELAAQATNVQQKMAKNRPLTAKEVESYQEYERQIVIASVRSPKIVEKDPNYDAGEISIDDLSDEEVTELGLFVQGGMEALRSFRVQRQRQIARFSSETLSDNETE